MTTPNERTAGPRSGPAAQKVSTSADDSTSTYADVAPLYGWGNLLPLPANQKAPVPSGFTGAAGRGVTDKDREKWAQSTGNFALVLPSTVVGIDVDDYAWVDEATGELHSKNGCADLAELEARLGELPATWMSTGRDPESGSGIRLYRVPEGTTVALSNLSPSIEVIRHEHRYAVCWPSRVVDGKGSRVYVWVDPAGTVADKPPALDDLAELPAAWVEYLSADDDDLDDLRPRLDIRREDVDPDYAREYVDEKIASLRATMLNASKLAEGEVDDHGDGWEKNQADLAYQVHRIALTPFSGYEEPAAAYALYKELTPDEMWSTTRYNGDTKWREQRTAARDKGGPLNVLGEAVGPGADRDRFEASVARELQRLEVRHEADRRFKEAHRPELPPFDLATLGEVLDRPEDEEERVPGVLMRKGSSLVIAQRKTGKTTFTVNLAHALLTGEPFLGKLPVVPVAGRVGFLNFEVSGKLLARWAAAVGIPRDRFVMVNLRGTANPLDDEGQRAALAARLRELDVEVLIVDPFGRAFSGDDQNAAGPVQRWLVDLDRFAREEVGASELVLTAHAGWSADHARGSSALEDWPDSIVYLTRADRPDSPVFISSTTRGDHDLDEDALDHNPLTHALALTGTGGRKAAAVTGLKAWLLDAIRGNEGQNSSHWDAAARADSGLAFRNGDVSKALNELAADGRLDRRKGQRNSCLWYIIDDFEQTVSDMGF